LETFLLAIILILASALIITLLFSNSVINELNTLKAIHQQTCQKLETAQCKNKCKYLGNEILEAEFLEEK
jgi:hypothetical protein